MSAKYRFPGKSKQRITFSDVLLPASELRRISDNFLQASFGGGVKRLREKNETIAYATRPKSQRALPCWCRHKTVEYTFGYSPNSDIRNTISSPTVKYLGFGETVDNEMAGSTIGQAAAKAALGVAYQDAALSNAQSLLDSVWSRIKPDLTEVSVPNFLWDIGQISSLWKLWNSRRGFLANVANANLNYQFGWKPTIGDISAMVNAVRTLQQKLRDWERSVGQLKKRQLTVSNNTIGKTGSAAVSSWGTVTWSVSFTQKVTAHIVFRPLPLKAYTDLEKLLRGTLDSLGFELNPKILWDAVPFSFVVDWFVNIGQYLERFKSDTLELPIKLEAAYLQNKETMIIDCRTRNNGVANEVPPSNYAGSHRVETFFNRVPTGPSLSIQNSPEWRTPTRNQAGLLFSLFASKH